MNRPLFAPDTAPLFRPIPHKERRRDTRRGYADKAMVAAKLADYYATEARKRHAWGYTGLASKYAALASSYSADAHTYERMSQ